ncbi:MAG: hypothetical protein L6Q99_05455 [Planctomycetes bacterium]|nr:hypothetical protein [Planctomycetota bacterium]
MLFRLISNAPWLGLAAASAWAAQAVSPSAPTPWVAQVPDSTLEVELRAPDFRPDAETFAARRKLLGEKLLVCGALTATGSDLVLVAERLADGTSAAQVRDARVGDGEERFDLGELPCLEARVVADPVVSVEYHAFVAAGRYVFDVQVLATAEGGEPAFGHAELAELAGGLRFAYLRRASWAEFPADVLAWMDAIARRMPNWYEATRADLEAEPKNWALAFAFAEALRFQGSPGAHAVPAYERVLELLSKDADASRSTELVRLLAHDGLGLSLCEDARTKESIAHFLAGYELGAKLRHDARAGLAYNAACSYAEIGDTEQALRWLADAIEILPRYRASARDDPSFAALRANDAFRKLTDEPPRQR